MLATPTPVEVKVEPRFGPSAADIASRIVGADPLAQAQADAQVRMRAAAVSASAEYSTSHQTIREGGSPARPKTIAGVATVKGVPSGDSVLIVGSAVANRIAPEKTITLAGITAPRLARREADDEPFAWASREFLRKLLIGKVVKFEVQHVHEGSAREYGIITLDDKDIATLIVKEGWATVKVPTKPKGNKTPDREELIAIESQAREAKRGIHQDVKDQKHFVRNLSWINGNAAQEVYKDLKGKKVRALVDHVREGSVLRCEILGENDSDLNHQIIMLHLAGVQAPRLPLPNRAKGKDSDEAGEEFALESQAFTSQRLLHREVTICIKGVDKSNNLYGAVTVPQGNISVLLVRHGLGRVVPWSAALIDERELLFDAEKQAKQEHLKIWRRFVSSSTGGSSDSKEFIGKAIQIHSTDSVSFLDAENNEIRVYLSSLRAPRPSVRDRKGEPWAAEGKEEMRRRLIGKKVKVEIDYKRLGSTDSKDEYERIYASIFLGKENVSETLIKHGLASVIRHRVDEERSPHYQALLNAEQEASDAKKGIHSPEPPAFKEVIDLTERIRVTVGGDTSTVESELKKQREISIKTKQFLPFLQKRKRVKAIVEHVFNGNRLKIFVPSENCVIFFLLGGVKCPSTRGNTPEPFGEEATRFVKGKVLQHDVEIEVETLDKGDNFIGTLLVNKKNLAAMLVERGFAEVVPFSADKSPYADQLYAAEKVAKQARLRLYKDWEAKEQAARLAYEASKPKDTQEAMLADSSRLRVTVSEIIDPTDFYVQTQGDPLLPKVEASLAKLASKPSDANFHPKKGDICAALYTDGSFYRSRVVAYVGDGYEVQFIDFGNRDVVQQNSLRQLPSELLKIPALAKAATLAACKTMHDYSDAATEAFATLVWEQKLQAIVESSDRASGVLHLSLTIEGDEKSVNEQLLEQGFVRIPSRPLRSLNKLIAKLKPVEKQAKSGHRNIWEYGDVSSDEEADGASIRR